VGSGGVEPRAVSGTGLQPVAPHGSLIAEPFNYIFVNT